MYNGNKIQMNHENIYIKNKYCVINCQKYQNDMFSVHTT